ncbi:YqhR family membrane protein [Metabacillus sp. Hm71]|uniref:YqhR family membrane protein n=1 Tax=Metabacillus sp. Hm71 TaxID=3450743 RepID=UPI003F444E66
MADDKKKTDDVKEEDNPRFEQNKREKPVSQIGKVISTGFIGGVFWSLLAYLASILNYTEIKPSLILQPIALGDWKNGTLGEFISIVLIGVISIGVALVYYAVLKRFTSMWIGIAYGAALWGLVFFILNPMFPDLKRIFELPRGTIVTTVCLYILYGLFVGYSISFDYNELNTNNEN